MSTISNPISYPRRVLIRKSMSSLARLLFHVLAKVERSGFERFPDKGPLILAGNHAAVLEAVMMAAYSPGLVEFVGSGDIPFDSRYAFIVKTYGFIPVNRGNLDRQGLNTAISVLEQGGIIGIFPEGGIWDAGQMQAQIGTAWLSYRAQAPIIPIGFGGIRDGLLSALKLKRPKLVMQVGEVIPPVRLDAHSVSMKASLEKSAQHILQKINALVPEEDLRLLNRKVDLEYTLNIKIHTDTLNGILSLPPEHLQVTHKDAYAHFLYNPTMIDALVHNLKLPLQPLMRVSECADLLPVIAAWDALLDYLKINPGFFTYRFGVEEGLAVELALKELRQLALWALNEGYALTLKPVHRYRNAYTGAEVIERGGCFPASMQP